MAGILAKQLEFFGLSIMDESFHCASSLGSSSDYRGKERFSDSHLSTPRTWQKHHIQELSNLRECCLRSKTKKDCSSEVECCKIKRPISPLKCSKLGEKSPSSDNRENTLKKTNHFEKQKIFSSKKNVAKSNVTFSPISPLNVMYRPTFDSFNRKRHTFLTNHTNSNRDTHSLTDLSKFHDENLKKVPSSGKHNIKYPKYLSISCDKFNAVDKKDFENYFYLLKETPSGLFLKQKKEWCENTFIQLFDTLSKDSLNSWNTETSTFLNSPLFNSQNICDDVDGTPNMSSNPAPESSGGKTGIDKEDRNPSCSIFLPEKFDKGTSAGAFDTFDSDLDIDTENFYFECYDGFGNTVNASCNTELSGGALDSRQDLAINYDEPLTLRYIGETNQEIRTMIIYSNKCLEDILKENKGMLSRKEIIELLLLRSRSYGPDPMQVIFNVEETLKTLDHACKSFSTGEVSSLFPPSKVKLNQNTKLNKCAKTDGNHSKLRFVSTVRNGPRPDKYKSEQKIQTKDSWKKVTKEQNEKRGHNQKEWIFKPTTSAKRHQSIYKDIPRPTPINPEWKLDLWDRKKLRVTLKKVNMDEIISPKFKHYFHFFATLGGRLKSGFVISKANSNFWLKKCGIISDEASSKMADDYFALVASKKLVLNIYDYVQYLIAIASDKRTLVSDLVRHLLAADISDDKNLKENTTRASERGEPERRILQLKKRQ